MYHSHYTAPEKQTEIVDIIRVRTAVDSDVLKNVHNQEILRDKRERRSQNEKLFH